MELTTNKSENSSPCQHSAEPASPVGVIVRDDRYDDGSLLILYLCACISGIHVYGIIDSVESDQLPQGPDFEKRQTASKSLDDMPSGEVIGAFSRVPFSTSNSILDFLLEAQKS